MAPRRTVPPPGAAALKPCPISGVRGPVERRTGSPRDLRCARWAAARRRQAQWSRPIVPTGRPRCPISAARALTANWRSRWFNLRPRSGQGATLPKALTLHSTRFGREQRRPPLHAAPRPLSRRNRRAALKIRLPPCSVSYRGPGKACRRLMAPASGFTHRHDLPGWSASTRPTSREASRVVEAGPTRSPPRRPFEERFARGRCARDRRTAEAIARSTWPQAMLRGSEFCGACPTSPNSRASKSTAGGTRWSKRR